MNKILAIKNINAYTIVMTILVIIALAIAFSDTSNVQSAHPIDISLMPCKLVDGIQVETTNFEIGSTPHICGKVLSEYLPLELDYYLLNSTSDDIILDNYVRIASHEFTVDLPSDLDIGQYEFEMKAGRRKHIATTIFEVGR